MRKSVLAVVLTGTLGVSGQAMALPKLEKLFTYESGIFDDSAAEIVAHDPLSQRLFVVNAATDSIDVLTLPPTPGGTLSLFASIALAGGSPNSVAIKNGIVAVAVEDAIVTNPGTVRFFDSGSLAALGSVGVGALPDMLTFNKAGTKVLVANEGEPDGGIDPEGSISIVDISSGVAGATVQTAGFGGFTVAQLQANGVRLFPGVDPTQDLEPEYIALSQDGQTAYVALQEANAFALVDVDSATVVDVIGLGTKNHALPGNELDASNRDGVINIANWPVSGLYMPDGIATFQAGGNTYVISANEGDTRNEDERVASLTLDPTVFPDAATLQHQENLGRLNVSTIDGDTDGDGDYDALFSYGARSFSIFDENGNLVYDSGDLIEQITAAIIPDFFNSNNDENSFDTRSDDKGPEPEGVAVGVLGDRTFAFLGLERVGGIMIFDITDPLSPFFVEYTLGRSFTDPIETSGDLGPEGVLFIDKKDSPYGKALLAVGNEVSGTTTVYAIETPEPATVALMVSGMVGIAAVARRRGR